MLKSPPREQPWVSWLYVVIWSLIIYVTIPFARAFQIFIYRQWSRDVFTYVTLAAIAISFVTATRCVIRRRPISRSSFFWLLAVAAIFFGYTMSLGKKSPEEAIHFIQYGMLGLLVFRALTHRLQDASIYFAAALICGIVGYIDELIQWITPQRYWGLGDIWINFFAAALVQVAIAKGLRPKFIDKPPSAANLRFLCRLTIAAIIIFGAALLNTPDRILWYAERIPGLAFLKHNDSVMLEYGYLYSHQDTGIFRSRFSSKELKFNDRKRGKEAAAILVRYRKKSEYKDFLKKYTPTSDPFVHEAGVHLYSRDINIDRAANDKNDTRKYAERLTVAFRENQIMEKYFSNTLHYSGAVWSADQLALVKRHLLPDWARESWVSRELVTRISEIQLGLFFTLLLAGLAILHWYLGKYSIPN